MEIDFSDYLTEEEKKEIVADTFRRHCLQKFQEDHERIFSNAAYSVVLSMVNESFDGEAMNKIAEKTKEVINELTTYTVFKRKDAWERDESSGFKALNEAIEQSKPLIKARIEKIIEDIDEKELREVTIEYMHELLDAKLFGKAA